MPHAPDKDITRTIAAYLATTLTIPAPDPETDLIEQSLIDSLAVMGLVNFLEKEFDLEIELDQITADNFRTVTAMAALVEAAR